MAAPHITGRGARWGAVAAAVLFAAGCAEAALPCETSTDCPPGEACVSGACARGGATDPRGELVALRVEPETAELLVTNGSPATQTFTAFGVYASGAEMVLPGVVFALDAPIGSLDPSTGVFAAEGSVAGEARVTASLVDPVAGVSRSASAQVTVRVEHTVFEAGAPSDAPARFVGAPLTDPARAPELVYPLDGAVMPRNVPPADVQWLRGDPGDLFRLELTKSLVRITTYLVHTGDGFRRGWLVSSPLWRLLAESLPEEPATIALERWEAATGAWVTTAPVSVRFAPAALQGAVYYWDIQAGRLFRIRDGSAEREDLMPTPPPVADGTRCIGCHTVSPSGRYLAGRLGGGDNLGATFDLTQDLSGDPPPTLFSVSPAGAGTIRWWFASWSPDETRLVVSSDEGGARNLLFVDPFAGTAVPVTGALPTGATHPAWSPDGTAIAYVENTNAWGGEFGTGDIALLPVTGPDTVGAPTTLHRGADLAGSIPAGSADSYPSWSPDSRLLAFANGTGCRSDTHHAALYAMARDGSNVVRLHRANGGWATNNFQPHFSPFESGDYFWVSFLSRRDYGNELAGNRGASLQQIWVAAVRKNAPPGTDPSEVAFWLPGQNPRTMNISAYWAPAPPG